MDPAPRENGSSGSGALPESPIDALGGGHAGNAPWPISRQLPTVPRCGKPCFMCGLPCNRPLGKHFIRLADDNPAHLCCQHDLHELYGE